MCISRNILIFVSIFTFLSLSLCFDEKLNDNSLLKTLLVFKKSTSLSGTDQNFTESSDVSEEPFICTPKNLDVFFEAKKKYRFLDYLLLQDIASSLIVNQARVLQNFQFLIKLPKDLSDKQKVTDFINNFNQYKTVIMEREELILCDVLSTLLALRFKNYTRLDSFLMTNETGDITINGTECKDELNLYTQSVNSYVENHDSPAIESIRRYYKEFIECTYKFYLKLTKLGDSFTPSLRELEYRLVNYVQLTKSNMIENLNIFTNATQLLIDNL